MPGKWDQNRKILLKFATLPDNRERKGCIDVNEQRGDFVQIMENEAIPPSNDCTSEWTIRQAVAGYK